MIYVKCKNNILIELNPVTKEYVATSRAGKTLYTSHDMLAVERFCEHCTQYLGVHPISLVINSVLFKLKFKPIIVTGGKEHFCEIKTSDKDYTVNIYTVTQRVTAAKAHYDVLLMKKGSVIIDKIETKTKEDSELLAVLKQIDAQLRRTGTYLVSKATKSRMGEKAQAVKTVVSDCKKDVSEIERGMREIEQCISEIELTYNGGLTVDRSKLSEEERVKFDESFDKLLETQKQLNEALAVWDKRSKVLTDTILSYVAERGKAEEKAVK